MKIRWAVIFSLAWFASCVNLRDQPPLDELIAMNTAARGGAPAIEAVRDYDSDIHIVEPSFEVDGRYVATRDGSMRVDILMDGERVLTEALHDGRGWSWSPGGGVTDASAQGVAALRHGIEFPFKLFGVHEMERRGHRLTTAGREKIGKIEYDVLTLTLDDGHESRYYLNPDTGLIERERQFRAMHVDVDPTPVWIETEYSDYCPVGEVLFPHRQVERRLDSGAVLSTLTIKAIRLNQEPAGNPFLPP
ncbi:MAG: hypothetical protein ACRES3_06955 [Steroidobacteraceae bacterium]